MQTRILTTLVLLVVSAFGQDTQKATNADAAHYPNLIHAELPLYPPLARTAHIVGTVELQVTVERGAVTDAQVKSSSSPFLSNPAIANVKTWQFQPEDRTVFLVTFVYQIKGKQTALPESPKIEMDLPRIVKVTAKPFKPTCSDCVSQNSGTGNETADLKDGTMQMEHADRPTYPPLARVARIFGTVEVQVTVKDGVVVNTEVKSSAHQTLVKAATENIKSWRFHPDVNTTFTTKFIYQLETKERLLADPRIESQLPFLVKITTVPPVLDTQNAQSARAMESTDTVDPATGNLRMTIPLVATAKPSH